VMLRTFDQLLQRHAEQLLAAGAVDTGRRGRIDIPLTPGQSVCLESAYRYYSAALRLWNLEDAATVASLHHQLGGITGKLARWYEADTHYRKAIAGHDQNGDVLRAAQSRYDFANHLIHRGTRTAEALLYARAALRDLLRLGPDQVGKTLDRVRALIDELEQTEN
jgi:tetratricopeptide (TPR) repeat protein